MNTIPSITKEDISRTVGVQNFQCGQKYFGQKRVFDTRRQGMTLKARSQGSQPQAYFVAVTFNEHGIAEKECSCPLGGYCKHVAALLLSWLAKPGEFVEQPTIDEMLAKLEKDELARFIKKMVRSEPQLEEMLFAVEQRSAPFNEQVYRRKIEQIFRPASNTWGVSADIAGELYRLKESADSYAEQGNYSSALSLYELMLGALLEHFFSYEDYEEGDFHSVVNDCVNDMGKWLDALQDKDLRERVLRLLFQIETFDTEQGGIGLGEEIPEMLRQHTTGEERAMLAGWIRSELVKPDPSGWGEEFRNQSYGYLLLDLQADVMDDEAYLRTCRETGRTADAVERLLELGRVDEAVQEAEKTIDHDLMHIADIFVEHRHETEAEMMIRKRARTSQDTRLQDWLKKFYLARNDKAAALDMAVDLFYKRPPVLAYYQEIRLLAKMLDRWETLRPALLAYLKKNNNAYLLTQIALDEGDVAEALALIKEQQVRARTAYSSGLGFGAGFSYGGFGSLEIEAAKAAEATLPAEALAIYQKHVSLQIDQRSRPSYQQACRYLLRVRDLYHQLGKDEQWTTYLTDLRNKHRPLRALKEGMANAGLM